MLRFGGEAQFDTMAHDFTSRCCPTCPESKHVGHGLALGGVGGGKDLSGGQRSFFVRLRGVCWCASSLEVTSTDGEPLAQRRLSHTPGRRLQRECRWRSTSNMNNSKKRGKEGKKKKKKEGASWSIGVSHHCSPRRTDGSRGRGMSLLAFHQLWLMAGRLPLFLRRHVVRLYCCCCC